MKDLVLGGKGFIGKHLIDGLTRRGTEVRTINHDERGGLENAENYESDFQWADRVWFLAWHVGIWKTASSEGYQLETLKRSLKLCESTFSVLEKTKKPFLFAASQLAGAPTPIGVSKAVGEFWAKNLSTGIVSKFWNVYGWEGVGEKSHVITDLVNQALTAKKVACGSSGEELRQFLYVTDCVDAIIHQFETGQKYADVTSWNWAPLKEVVRLIAEQRGVPFSLGEKKGGDSFAEPKVHLEGWEPKFSLGDGVALTIKEALRDLKISE